MAGRRQNGEGTIYAYRSGYAAQVFVLTPEGRRVRKTVYGKTRKEAQEKWVRLQSQSRRGPVTTTIPRLDEFAADWLRDVVRPNLAPSTVANYELFIRLYIAPELGRKRLDRLGVRDIRLWLNELKERCQCCAQGKDKARGKPRCCDAGNCCQQTASEWTVHQAWTVLRSMLSEAMRDELVTRNVAALVKLPLPRPSKRTYWNVDEARQFLESAKTRDDPLYAGYVLMLILGLRRGELLGLGWEDLDLEVGEAHIAWQLQRLGGELVRRRTKTHSSEAPLPLPDICVEALKHRRRVENTLRLAAGETWNSSGGLVLTTRFGDAIDPRNFQRAFRSSVRRAGVPVIPVHSTRRTCASLLVALDVHPRVAMAILRHSKIAVTMDIYSQVSAASTREALKRLGEAFV